MNVIRKKNRYQLLLVSFVLFNAFLCAICKYVSVTNTDVALFQAFLFFWMVVEMLWARMLAYRDFVYLLLLFICVFAANLFNSEFAAKSFFDCFVVPLAVMFGWKSGIDYWFVVKRLFWCIFFVAIIEYTISDLYLNYFPVGEYYFKTRDWVGDKTIDSSELTYYQGAYRAGGSVFFEGHRISSLLLDPITFGYFLVLFYCSCLIWEKNARWRYVYFALCTWLSLISDTRIAVVLISFAFLCSHIRILRACPVPVYWLLIWVCAYVIHLYFQGADTDLSYRLGYTFDGLANNTVESILGFGDLYGKQNDSGYLYLLDKMGLIGLLLTHLYFLNFYLKYPVVQFRNTFILFAVFFMVTFFLGSASLSVKVAILWGVFLGKSMPMEIERSHAWKHGQLESQYVPA